MNKAVVRIVKLDAKRVTFFNAVVPLRHAEHILSKIIPLMLSRGLLFPESNHQEQKPALDRGFPT